MAPSTGLTILQVLSWLNYGGVESYVVRLSRALQARGHRLLVASCGGQLEPELAAAGIAHFRVDFTGGKSLSGAAALRRLMEREGVDLVNAHNWRAGMVSHLATRRAGVPYLLTIHGTRKAVNRFWVFYWSDLVAVVSEASRRNLVDDFGLPEGRVVTTMIGVDCARFRPAPPDPELEAELGLAPGAPRVVHVSRYSHSKAPVALALTEASARLARTAPELEIVLAGQGPEAAKVAAAAAEVNARAGRRLVHALPGRADIARVLNLGQVTVATASVALEAMACGKALVAAGKGGFLGTVTPENLPAAEATCFADHQAVEAISADRLAGDLEALLSDPERAAQLGRQLRTAVESRSDLGPLGAEVEGLYRRVLVDRGRVRRIAVFHLNQIGDLVFTLPALKALREGFPEARITSVVRPHLAGLLTHSGFVDEIVRRPGSGARAAVKLGLGLRRRRLDLAVALSQSASMAFCAWLSGAPHRIGYLDSDLPRMLNHRVQERGIPCPSKVLHLVRSLGLAPAQTEYVGLLRVSPEDEAAAARLLAEARLEGNGPLIALAPGESARRPYKSWSGAGFAAVAAALREEVGARLLVVGSGRDRPLGEEIGVGAGGGVANLAGLTTPSELAAVLARCDALLGIDSGPMHLAAAMGCPVVGLFGPTDPARTGPQGRGHKIIFHRQPCWPCMTPTCQDRPCMKAITVEEVLVAVRRVVGAPAAEEQRR